MAKSPSENKLLHRNAISLPGISVDDNQVPCNLSLTHKTSAFCGIRWMTSADSGAHTDELCLLQAPGFQGWKHHFLLWAVPNQWQGSLFQNHLGNSTMNGVLLADSQMVWQHVRPTSTCLPHPRGSSASGTTPASSNPGQPSCHDGKLTNRLVRIPVVQEWRLD